jgi:hypothetical protein
LERRSKPGAVDTSLNIRGLAPAGPNFARICAMLLDGQGRLRLSWTSQDGSISLSKKLERYLRIMAVKAEKSPLLVLKETIPGLDLSELVRFPPGSSELPPGTDQILAAYVRLLAARPRLGLLLKPSYDAEADREVIRARLQAKADARAAAENQQRAKARARREKLRRQEEARRRAILAKNPETVFSDPLAPVDTAQELAPVQPEQVVVPDSVLERLALERAEAVVSCLVWERGVAPNRVEVDEDHIGQGQAGVKFGFTALQ